MTEKKAGQDAWFGYCGCVMACGWCGATALSDFPDCCAKMRSWKARLAAPPPMPDEPNPYSHEELRWARVCRRLASKHVA